MTTIRSNDNRTWNVVETKSVTNKNGQVITVNLCHANVKPEAMAYADWSVVCRLQEMTRCKTLENESAAREYFNSVK